jgi:hypothetical protein
MDKFLGEPDRDSLVIKPRKSLLIFRFSVRMEMRFRSSMGKKISKQWRKNETDWWQVPSGCKYQQEMYLTQISKSLLIEWMVLGEESQPTSLCRGPVPHFNVHFTWLDNEYIL